MKKSGLVILLLISTQLSLFGQEENVEEGKQRPRLNDNTIAFKFSPMQLIVGEFNLGFEAQTSIKTSIEIEVGPTISNVGFSRLTYIPEDGNNVTENSALGYFISLGLRYYPLEKTEALNRFYVSPVLKYRVYNYTLSEGSGSLEDIQATKTQVKFHFIFGDQLWASKSFAFDFFLGPGIGFQEITNYDAAAFYENFDYTYYWDKKIESKPQLLLTAGVKIGLGH